MSKKIKLHYADVFLHCDCGTVDNRILTVTINYKDELDVVVYENRVYVGLCRGSYEEILAPVVETLEEIKEMADVDVTYYNKKDAL